ncbi:hypothetical protein C8F01DRAFT_1142265 [Mycena amicta]|nr:hypothetical protein C8F01DRAFT_1142265 [Mycena amicta]
MVLRRVKSSDYSSQATSVGRCLLNIAQDLYKHSSTTFRNRPYIKRAPDFCRANTSARWEGKAGAGLAVQHGPPGLLSSEFLYMLLIRCDATRGRLPPPIPFTSNPKHESNGHRCWILPMAMPVSERPHNTYQYYTHDARPLQQRRRTTRGGTWYMPRCCKLSGVHHNLAARFDSATNRRICAQTRW